MNGRPKLWIACPICKQSMRYSGWGFSDNDDNDDNDNGAPEQAR